MTYHVRRQAFLTLRALTTFLISVHFYSAILTKFSCQ